ncbi:hypothetical protein H0H92_014788 [Tricholoma furcatifolium]|nr:hypothetical protein H0H92_014788 [Tricholoma furcatifolium]
MQEDDDRSLRLELRLEWLKARARAQRWREEVMLVEEEMRRVLEYCRWRADWWERQECRRTASPLLQEGLIAYVTEQANIERSRASAWQAQWEDLRARAQETLRDELLPFPTIEVQLDGEDEEDYWEEDMD